MRGVGARNVRLSVEVAAVARAVLRQRRSATIIATSTAGNHIRTLLAEYRAYMSEAERQLLRDGFRASFTMTETLREIWSDTLAEHRQWPAGLVN